MVLPWSYAGVMKKFLYSYHVKRCKTLQSEASQITHRMEHGYFSTNAQRLIVRPIEVKKSDGPFDSTIRVGEEAFQMI